MALKYYEASHETARQRMLLHEVNIYAQHIQTRLSDNLSALNSLKSILLLEDFNCRQFVYWGRIILKAHPDLSAVQLAPDGVVRHIVPIEGNEKALGHDLLADKHRDGGARKTIESKKTTLIGPVRLIQNGRMALIAREPVFREIDGKASFWGFVIVLLEPDALIKDIGALKDDKSLAWRILGQDPDRDGTTGRPMIAQSTNAGDVSDWDVSYDIMVPNGQWRMQLAFVKTSSALNILRQVMIVLMTGFFTTMLYHRKKNLEAMDNRLRSETNFALFSNTLFLDSENALNHSLQHLLRAANCSRVYIFENFIDKQGRLAFRQTHEVCADGVPPELDNPALQHLVYERDGFERWKEELSRNNIVMGNVATFPEPEKAVLEPQQIKSILVLPIWGRHEWHGFIGFDAVHKAIDWTDADVNLLRAASEILGQYRERKQAEESLRASEERFRMAFENANDGVCMVDLDGGIRQVNKRMCAIFGYSKAELEQMTVDEITHPDDRTVSPAFIKSAVNGEVTSSVFEKRYLHKSGRLVWGQVSSSLILDSRGEPLNFISHVQDITRRKEVEEELRRMATTDELTQLANRRRFMKVAAREIARGRRYRTPFSLIMFDADKFKGINDTYGHDVGDKVLKAIAATATDVLRDVDVIGRLGGEEFAAGLPETDLESAMLVAERLRASIEKTSIELQGGGKVEVTVSLGVAALDDSCKDVEALLKQADMALYAAKEKGRNRVEFFRQGMP